MTDFTRVMLTDKLAWQLFGQAGKEGLLYRTEGSDDAPKRGRGPIAQRALAFLVLFEKVLLHDFGEGTFRIPDLENAGVLQIVARGAPEEPVTPLKARWKKGPLRNRRRPPVSLLRSLALLKEERALVIERLLTTRSEWELTLARHLGISRTRFLEEFLGYAIASVEGDTAVLENTVLHQLPKGVLADWTKRLFDFKGKEDALAEVDAKLVFAIAFADEIRIIQELSKQLGVGVASEHYQARYKPRPPALDLHAMADHFAVVRVALGEDGGVVPRVRDIEHAQALRRDPNLGALREMLGAFHAALQSGDTDALTRARREVAKAKRAMARRDIWQKSLDWVTYFALPVGIVETVLGAPPIVGTSLSVVGATGAAHVSRTNKRNRWVLFGR